MKTYKTLKYADKFRFVVGKAKNADGMTASDTIAFHYFNPNGLWAEAKLLIDRVWDLVDANKVKSGWLLAYGFDWHYEQLVKLQEMKKPRWRNVKVFIKMLKYEIEKVEMKVAKEENK